MNISLLFLSLFLGFIHSFDADHIFTITALNSEKKSKFQQIKNALFWGIGHAGTIILFAILYFIIQEFYNWQLNENLEFWFDLIVGLTMFGMAIFIIKRHSHHFHWHTHRGKIHWHFHNHQTNNDSHHHHQHGYWQSLFMGFLHGLAGSTPIIIIMLQKSLGKIASLVNISVFAFGTILGMIIFSGIFAIPMQYLRHNHQKIYFFSRIFWALVMAVVGFNLIFGFFW